MDDGEHAYSLLSPGLQRQLYAVGWQSLRPVQARAIMAYAGSSDDLLIMAETAGGKTEAAFLPVLSSIADDGPGSVRAIYIGPLKALINDQFQRLEDLCTHLDMTVTKWHGDASQGQKESLLRQPRGVLLITPESLESLLINRTAHLPAMFGGLRAIVIDEVHAFLEGERGLHLASLLSRVRRYASTPAPPRLIGLSATVGDPMVAQRFLNPDDPYSVAVIDDPGAGKEVLIRVHGYPRHADASSPQERETRADRDELVMGDIAEDLAQHCHESSNLIFANAKGDIEIHADMANEQCRQNGWKESFLVHHGSLSREVREDTEADMKQGRALTTVCSSTLEMGVDIGAVRLVGQIGAPWSVASLKQRMGRSGRRDGEPRRLRAYARCDARGSDNDPLGPMPIDLLQTVAVCELMLMGWVEPASPAACDLSTLTHQIISTIAECGAISAIELFRRLCVQGPFRAIDQRLMARVLRCLAAKDVVEQDQVGLLMLGLEGEQIRKRRDFYAAFASRTEFAIVAGARQLGQLPIETIPQVGSHLVFAARRWRISDVDQQRLTIYVEPSTRRERPVFLGSGGEVDARIREEMASLLHSSRMPAYLDSTASSSLGKAQADARELNTCTPSIVGLADSRCLWMTWTGTREQRTLLAMLNAAGVNGEDRSVAIECRVGRAELLQTLVSIRSSQPDRGVIAGHVQPKQLRKYDSLLTDELLDEGIAKDRIDVDGALACIEASLK